MLVRLGYCTIQEVEVDRLDLWLWISHGFSRPKWADTSNDDTCDACPGPQILKAFIFETLL